MTKTMSMKADLGGGEGIAIRHQLLSSKIDGYFFSMEITLFFFPFPVFSDEVILDSNQSKKVFTLMYIKRGLEGKMFL